MKVEKRGRKSENEGTKRNRSVEFGEEKKKKRGGKRASGRDFSVNTSGGRRGRARKSRNRRREAQSAARITGSILSCDSSRFDYEALAFAPHLPPDRVYLPLPPADDLTPRPVTPRPRYSDYIQTRRSTSKLPRNTHPSSATPSMRWSRYSDPDF